MTPPTSDLRQYLTAAYSDEELVTLCADYFRAVYEDFATGMSKGQKIHRLLDYCERRELLGNLAGALERDRPDQFRAHFAVTAAPRTAPPPVNRDPARIFISHAHEDADFAHRLAADLAAAGWRVWITPESIRPGEKWAEAINRGLEECGMFVVALTPAAIASGWVRTETNVAIELMHSGEARFIPLHVADCRPPALWRAFQWISFIGRYPAGLTELLAALQPEPVSGSTRPGGQSASGTRPEPVEGRPPTPAAASTQPGGQSASGTHPEPVEGPRPTPAAASTRPGGQSASGTRPEPVEGARPTPAAASTRPGGQSASGTRPKPIEGPPAVLTLTAPIPLKLIRIPAGEFLMGSDPAVDREAQDNEKPQHRLYLTDFYIGKVPVTNAQYAAFVNAAKHRVPDHWSNGRIPGGKENHPVVWVSWHDAVAFCRWLSEATRQPFRLPTEAEWEKAARGPAPSAFTSSAPSAGSGRGRIYPWGDEPPDKICCNFNQNVGNTTPVGQYAAGATPDTGVLDLAGNVWEWTRSLWGKDGLRPDFGYPYKPLDGRESQVASDGVLRIVRGGSWWGDRTYVRCAFRNWNSPDDRIGINGFRVARSSP